MRNRLLPLIMISSALVVAADNGTTREGSAGVPVMGYAFGAQTRELRAILGVPGASRWSDPLALPDGVTALRVAPGHRWALVLRESGEAGVLVLDSLTYAPIADALDNLDGVRFSPAGTAMVLSTGAIYRGLPDDVKRAGEAGIADLMAVSDSGEVAALRDGRLMKGSEFLRECSAECRFAFFPGTDSSLAVLDGGRLTEMSGSDARILADEVDAAEMMLAANKTVLLSAGTTLRVIDRASGALVRSEDLPAVATRLEAMRHADAVLLSSGSEESDAAWMFSQEGVRFVPARAAAPAASEVKE